MVEGRVTQLRLLELWNPECGGNAFKVENNAQLVTVLSAYNESLGVFLFPISNFRYIR